MTPTAGSQLDHFCSQAQSAFQHYELAIVFRQEEMPDKGKYKLILCIDDSNMYFKAFNGGGYLRFDISQEQLLNRAISNVDRDRIQFQLERLKKLVREDIISEERVKRSIESILGYDSFVTYFEHLNIAIEDLCRTTSITRPDTPFKDTPVHQAKVMAERLLDEAMPLWEQLIPLLEVFARRKLQVRNMGTDIDDCVSISIRKFFEGWDYRRCAISFIAKVTGNEYDRFYKKSKRGLDFGDEDTDDLPDLHSEKIDFEEVFRQLNNIEDGYLIIKKYEGVTQTQMAKELGVSDSTITRRINECRVQLSTKPFFQDLVGGRIY